MSCGSPQQSWWQNLPHQFLLHFTCCLLLDAFRGHVDVLLRFPLQQSREESGSRSTGPNPAALLS